jgi:hypothetical protein
MMVYTGQGRSKLKSVQVNFLYTTKILLLSAMLVLMKIIRNLLRVLRWHFICILKNPTFFCCRITFFPSVLLAGNGETTCFFRFFH